MGESSLPLSRLSVELACLRSSRCNRLNILPSLLPRPRPTRLAIHSRLITDLPTRNAPGGRRILVDAQLVLEVPALLLLALCQGEGE